MSAILSIDQLIVPLTPLQVKTKIYEVLAQLNVSTTNWKPGAVVRLIVAAVSIVLSALSVMISELAKSAFLTLSEGAWLTLVARHVYGVERSAATFASGGLTLYNTTGTTYSRGIGELTFSNPTTGKTFTNTEPLVSFAPNTQVTLTIRATEAGADSSSGPGMIMRMVTPLLGVTCSNAYSIIGQDEQSDGSLIAECLLKPQALSPNGARGAYTYFAKRATRADGSVIGINRVSTSNASSTGTVTVTVATPSGAVGNSDVAYVKKNIAENCLPGCVTLTAQSAQNKAVNFAFWAYFKDFEMSAEDQVRAVAPVVDQWLASIDIGGQRLLGIATNRLFRDTIRDVISSAFAVRPELVVIYAPADDAVILSNEIPLRGSIRAGMS